MMAWHAQTIMSGLKLITAAALPYKSVDNNTIPYLQGRSSCTSRSTL